MLMFIHTWMLESQEGHWAWNCVCHMYLCSFY